MTASLWSEMLNSSALSIMLQLMREDGTEARISDAEPTTVDQQAASVAVGDASTEAPSSSTVAPATSLGSDEIANGYRYQSL